MTANLTSLFYTGFPGVNTIALSGEVMPGQWILQPGGKPFGWQEQKGISLTGATLRAIGDPLVHVVFLVKFWTVADWDKFQPLREKYLVRPAFSTSKAFTYAIGIIHPELNALGIDAIVPEETPFFTNNGKGLWTGNVKLQQYRKPIAALESPPAVLPAAAKPVPASLDNLDRIIQAQEEQIRAHR